MMVFNIIYGPHFLSGQKRNSEMNPVFCFYCMGNVYCIAIVNKCWVFKENIIVESPWAQKRGFKNISAYTGCSTSKVPNSGKRMYGSK